MSTWLARRMAPARVDVTTTCPPALRIAAAAHDEQHQAAPTDVAHAHDRHGGAGDSRRNKIVEPENGHDNSFALSKNEGNWKCLRGFSRQTLFNGMRHTGEL